MKKFSLLLILCIGFIPFIQAQDSVAFVYQGRVNVQGGPFTGTGQFKFALYTKDGPTEHYVWFNDGPITGAEPVNAISIPVADGVFSVIIGETSIPNMAALSSVLFNSNDRIWLRTWFNDGVHGFEQLNPDKRIVNPELIGIKQKTNIEIYVNATTGNDHWSGLLPTRAKKTIQAAVDALPPVIDKPATIFVADGTYYEQVTLKNINLGSADASLSLIGNTTTPANVVVSGADSGAPTVPVRSTAIQVEDSRGITISGFKVQYAINNGLVLVRSTGSVSNCVAFECGAYGYSAATLSTIQLDNSSVSNCHGGFHGTSNSVCNIDGLTVNNIVTHGVSVNNNSTLGIRNSTITNCGRTGIIVWTHSQGSIVNTTIGSCGSVDASYWSNVAVWGVSMVKIYYSIIENAAGVGLEVKENSYVEFRDENAPNTNIIRNCPIGLEAFLMSGAYNMNSVGLTFTNCTKNYQIYTDGKVYLFPPNN